MTQQTQGVHRISVQALAKDEAKELHRVVREFGAACTVKMARDFCSPGPVLTGFLTVLVVLFFVGLSVLWLPFLLCAVVAFFAVPWKVANARTRWLQLLPVDKDGDLLELV